MLRAGETSRRDLPTQHDVSSYKSSVTALCILGIDTHVHPRWEKWVTNSKHLVRVGQTGNQSVVVRMSPQFSGGEGESLKLGAVAIHATYGALNVLLYIKLTSLVSPSEGQSTQ